MRLLTLSWEYPPRVIGGLARHVQELSQAQARFGHDVHVVTAPHPGEPDTRVDQGVHVHRVQGWDQPTPDFISWALQLNVAMLTEALRLHQELPFDLVHAHDWMTAHAGIGVKRAAHIPLLATVHATEFGRMRGIHNDTQRFIHQIEWWMNYESWRSIVCSHYMKRELHDLFQLPLDKIDVIPNGVDSGKFDLQFDPLSFRRLYAADHDKLILTVGRMVHEKGMGVLLESVPALLARVPQAKLVFCGTGGELDYLRERAWQLGVAPHVVFTGYIDDKSLHQLFKVADAAVFPSLYEPFGIVALEGMAAPLPTVVTDTGGFSEIVEDGVTGLKVPPNDALALADALARILHDPGLADHLRRHAKEVVNQRYDWDKIAQQTNQVYQRVRQEATKWL